MPRFIQRLYPERIWAFSRKKDSVYLTFDDGPIPEVTPWVLDELKKHNAKATFFCIGENVKKHPEIFRRIIAEGHSVGNHTFNHLNGWQTKTTQYIENVEKAEREMINNSKINSQQSTISNQPSLFRPPYGKITSKQAKILQKKGFKIVMWDIISYDYDATISEEKCLQNVLKNIKPGSVVVFHDSLKAEKNLRYVLPKVLDRIEEKGLSYKSIC
ncbi:polysaccharide deacetylase family protein [Aequorivita sp. CIP111184]|uniref:polysaccharide deacetylase family protein n=1 Tax=Aequorivita sp. CIP111184 TaxID=2211356 RepID=UPI000DBC04B9|nr:polysaccharide deacetylase family protein [Aequorivita sp. CIP111184]SRX52899.1 Peptidoglycan-N-acetylglucosamine deacetylase [Aequorivita sp. CIP111184]